MPVCGRFRKSPQAGPCKTAQRSGCRPHAPYRKPGRRRRRAAFPPAFPYFPADVGHRRADYEAPGFRLPQRDGAFQGSRHFPFSGQGNGTAPGFRERKFSVLPNGFLCESRSRTAPPPRSSFRLIRCLPEAQFPSVLGPAEGEGSGRSSVARRSLRGRVLRFPPLSAGRFPQGFSSSRPTVRHMTYRNRAIVSPRCGLQRAGSVPPRSAERRAVRRPRSGRATADGSSVFRRFQRGRFSRGFSSSRPTVRHMTYRNRAIVPPRCGLQRAGSVPPRSAERRAVRRPRSGRATADGSPPVHGFRPSCGTDSAAPGGRLLGRRGIRRPPPVSRRVSVILPFRINKRPPPLDKRLRRSYLCRVSVSRAPPASGNQVYLGRPPSTASRAIREIELIPPARTRTSCGRAPQRSVRFFPGLRPRQALPIPALAGCGA
ncbi:hypothetical protein BN3659_01154 [Alistipes sp. CHKCI003]|nr:hypothetical protein BN3659_01154 [Alistipes sp. CHKCI003]